MSIDSIAGTRLPEGTWTITREDNAVVGEVIGTPPERRDEIHPLWAYLCPHSGIAIDVDGLLTLAGATAADGPMAATFTFDDLEPMQFDVEYRVTGEVVSLERKHGRTIGPFDLFTFREHVAAPDGEQVATVTFSWILPRRDA